MKTEKNDLFEINLELYVQMFTVHYKLDAPTLDSTNLKYLSIP